MGLTTHVLDTANGEPAAGVSVRLYGLDDGRALLATAETNADGRTDAPLVADGELAAGTYEIEFDIGPYFRSRDFELSEPAFLDTVVIRVSLASGQHYHVPLLVSPWSYSTYRGS